MTKSPKYELVEIILESSLCHSSFANRCECEMEARYLAQAILDAGYIHRSQAVEEVEVDKEAIKKAYEKDDVWDGDVIDLYLLCKALATSNIIKLKRK